VVAWGGGVDQGGPLEGGVDQGAPSESESVAVLVLYPAQLPHPFGIYWADTADHIARGLKTC
jgi:hypothetical protein